MVVAISPFFDHSAHLIKSFKKVAIQHLGTISAIKPFDASILDRFSELNES